MSEITSLLAQLNRPRLLVHAARIGLRDYNRDKLLPKLLEGPLPASSRYIAFRLLAMEAALDDARCSGNAGYSVARHIEVLAAIMCESELLRDGKKRANTVINRPAIMQVV